MKFILAKGDLYQQKGAVLQDFDGGPPAGQSTTGLRRTIFYFLNADPQGSKCTVKVTGQTVNLSDGDGIQVTCQLKFEGLVDFMTVLKKQPDV